MTELELQRIVDGEMTSADRACCLKQLDDQSPQWRSLALGLLADQDLRRCFQTAEAGVSQVNVATASTSQATYPARWTMALAASLLIAVAGGAWWLRGELSNSDSASKDQLAATEAKVIGPEPELQVSPVVEEPPQPKLVSWQPTGKMMLSAPGESETPVELPVYEVEQLSPQAIANQQLVELKTLTEQFSKQGWRTGLDTHVYEGQLEDGRKLYIPVNVMHLEPISY